MAFKPITIEKEIKGVKYVAQFNGMSARSEILCPAVKRTTRSPFWM